MSLQAYFRIERGGNMVVTMDMMELIFNDNSEFLVKYDTNTNLPPIFGCHD